MKGRIIAKANGVEMRNRIYRNYGEKERYLNEYKSLYGDCEIITSDFITHYCNKSISNVDKEVRVVILNWFGSITGYLAETLVKRRFHLDIRDVAFEHMQILWLEFGKPRYFKFDTVQTYIDHLNESFYHTVKSQTI